MYSIEEVFKAMASETPALEGLSLAKIGDLGVQLDIPEIATPRDVPKSATATR